MRPHLSQQQELDAQHEMICLRQSHLKRCQAGYQGSSVHTGYIINAQKALNAYHQHDCKRKVEGRQVHNTLLVFVMPFNQDGIFKRANTRLQDHMLM